MNFYLTFGDVMTTQETVGYLAQSAASQGLLKTA
jgi:hypothetical protein